MTQIIKPEKNSPEVADIFQQYMDDYQAQYPLWPQHRKIVSDLLNCRTAHLGGHIERIVVSRFINPPERYAYTSMYGESRAPLPGAVTVGGNLGEGEAEHGYVGPAAPTEDGRGKEPVDAALHHPRLNPGQVP